MKREGEIKGEIDKGGGKREGVVEEGGGRGTGRTS